MALHDSAGYDLRLAVRACVKKLPDIPGLVFATRPSMYQGSWEAVHTSTFPRLTDTTPARGSIAACAQNGVS